MPAHAPPAAEDGQSSICAASEPAGLGIARIGTLSGGELATSMIAGASALICMMESVCHSHCRLARSSEDGCHKEDQEH